MHNLCIKQAVKFEKKFAKFLGFLTACWSFSYDKNAKLKYSVKVIVGVEIKEMLKFCANHLWGLLLIVL